MSAKAHHTILTELSAFSRGLVDPRGRTSRTGLVIYVLAATGLANATLWLIKDVWEFSLATPDTYSLILMGMLIIVPMIRRCHDFGNAGWIALVAPATLCLKAYGTYLWETGQSLSPGLDYPLNAVALGLVVAFWVIFFWPPKQEQNRFGPIPHSRLRRAAA
ncbi:DUF805 domain-containing protein [Aurantiacibacter zhengii]|uniref:DUF805 domain-containing protein n=1 Tax=Aurantiacibacter zhengii TaxID=2307003 RepID=A0A418NX73_9SPHN|nr:DUF805 domain-containing protein [Aurantiacibacter zhengii]RIV89231.1 DUF805 domain-containing protein [Aurantiacibacter zhengii]